MYRGGAIIILTPLLHLFLISLLSMHLSPHISPIFIYFLRQWQLMSTVSVHNPFAPLGIAISGYRLSAIYLNYIR
jgi:hypothetical protein